MTAVIFQSSFPGCYFWETPTVFLSGGSDDDNKCGDGNRWALQPSAQPWQESKKGPNQMPEWPPRASWFLRSFPIKCIKFSLFYHWNFGSSVLQVLGTNILRSVLQHSTILLSIVWGLGEVVVYISCEWTVAFTRCYVHPVCTDAN